MSTSQNLKLNKFKFEFVKILCRLPSKQSLKNSLANVMNQNIYLFGHDNSTDYETDYETDSDQDIELHILE